MSVRDDLIAAKALIDTPDKWQDREMSVIQAVAVATRGQEAYTRAKAALFAQIPREFVRSSVFDALHAYDKSAPSHAAVMALFDRAIEAAK